MQKLGVNYLSLVLDESQFRESRLLAFHAHMDLTGFCHFTLCVCPRESATSLRPLSYMDGNGNSVT